MYSLAGCTKRKETQRKLLLLLIMRDPKHFFGVIVLLLFINIPAWAQNIDVSYHQRPLEQVFTDLKNKTGYEFIYQKKILTGEKPVTLTMNNVLFTEVLDRIFMNRELGYDITKKTIVVHKAEKARQSFRKSVAGQVIDENGEPLPGANIRVKGTSYGTISNAEGRFNIDVDGKNPILLISYVGMNDKEYMITSKTRGSIQIVLSNNANLMQEVVVTGYQKLKRESATGAYQTITAKDLDMRYTGDITSNLEGKVPGLVNYNNGVSSGIVIRGNGSLNATNHPLVVVDGLPISGSIDTVNPYNVENITVLKDAAAAAIYGARASNGVIVVTTKRAQTEKLTVDVNADVTIHNQYDYSNHNWCDAAELLELEQYNFNYVVNNKSAYRALSGQYSKRGNLLSPITQLMMKHQLGKITDDEYKSTIDKWNKNDYRGEWMDLMNHNQIEQQYNVAIRTKGKYLNSSIIADYKGDNTTMVNQYSHELSLSYRGDLDVTKWMNLEFGVSLNNTRSKYYADDSWNRKGITDFAPYQSMYNEDGTPATLMAYVALDEPSLANKDLGLKSEGFCMVDEKNRNFETSRSTYTRSYVHLNVNPIPELKLSGLFQYEDIYDRSKSYFEADSYMMRHIYNLYTSGGKHYMPDGGMLKHSSGEENNYTFRAQATFDKTFADKHAVEAVAGYEFRQNKSNSAWSYIYGYDDQTLSNAMTKINFNDIDNLESTDLGSNYSPNYSFPSSIADTEEVKHRYLSYYFTGNYIFDKRYSASFSYRVDKTDLFGADPKFRRRPLWSVGASWNIQNETFMKNIKWINVLKLRASYGLTGNIATGYSSYLTANVGSIGLTSDKYATLNTPPNDALRWEKTASWNVGLDFSVLSNRLFGSLDLYRKNSTDLLSLTDLDPTSGWSSLRINNAKALNQGVELQLNGAIIAPKKAGELAINASLSLAYNKNEIKKLSHKPTSGVNALNSYREGDPVHSLYSFAFDHFEYDSSDNQQLAWRKADGTTSYENIYSSQFTVDDIIFSGSLDPKLSVSFSPEISYKGFSLSAMMVYYGGHYFRANAQEWSRSGSYEGYGNAVPKSYLNYWRASETDRKNMLANGYPSTNMKMYSSDLQYIDQNVAPADYMKIRNIILGYRLPRLFCQKLGLQGLRLRFQMNNVATWVRNSYGVDPEAVNPDTGAILSKTPKSYTFSVSVNY
jgi:TonB-linked SusC/RagA family outer membrane protein